MHACCAGLFLASRAAVALLAAADNAATVCWGGLSPGVTRLVRLLHRSVVVVVCQDAGVPNSMGSYTQGGRYVSGLALAPFLASGCRVACVGPVAVTRFLVTAWARAEGRVIQGYLRVPPGARFSVLPLLGSGQSAVYPGVPSGAAWCRCSVRPWRVEEEEGTRTVVGIGHPQLRAFLVLAPGLR